MQKEKLAIIVAYRNREEHLGQFLPYMQEFLKDIPFRIYIIEQMDTRPFNRAKLMNIGYDVSKEETDYMGFHDVDMLPIKADYSYTEEITHLAAEAEQFGWRLPYNDYLGGVTLFPHERFIKINGYSNNFWGWGAEDDDLSKRSKHRGLKIERRNGRYRSLAHERVIDSVQYKQSYDYLTKQENSEQREQIMNIDGLNTLLYTEVYRENINDNVTLIKVFL